MVARQITPSSSVASHTGPGACSGSRSVRQLGVCATLDALCAAPGPALPEDCPIGRMSASVARPSAPEQAGEFMLCAQRTRAGTMRFRWPRRDDFDGPGAALVLYYEQS